MTLEHDGPLAAKMKRVCVLTGGGDAPGLNAVLRAFVKSAIHGGLEVLGSEDGFDGLVQGSVIPMNEASVRGILPRGGSILGCSNRANPFAYPRMDGDKEIYVDVSQLVIDRLRALDVDALVLVGGDGTMTMALRFLELGVPVVGIPKTIDNDLGATDRTFGFDTAVNTATWAIDALHSTAEAHDRVMILELMGRYAGWIALSAGIAGGADVVLVPEIPYDIERVIAKIRARSENGSRFSIAVVGEGAMPIGGAASAITAGVKGHLPRLGGAGLRLEQAIVGRVSHDVRTTVLGHLQRGGSPAAADRLLGTRFGVHATQLCLARATGRMVALRGESIGSVTIREALGAPKLVPPHGELASTARALGIELGAP